MKNLKLLTVAFDTTIAPYEVPAFRGAIAEKVGFEHDWYHNHNNDPNAEVAYHYRYPLVQYKTKSINEQGQRKLLPMLVFIDKIEEAQHFFMQQNWDLEFAGKFHKMTIAEMRTQNVEVGIKDDVFDYTIRNWMALNEQNYPKYTQLDGEAERISFLEQKLANHIISFCKGINYRFKGRFEVKIDRILDVKPLKYEGIKVMGFSVRFKSNFNLPSYVGLGKGVSQGFGVVTPFKKTRN